MTDRGDNRDLTGIYCSCYTLVIEAEQLFIRTAASCDNDYVNVFLCIKVLDSCNYFRRTLCTLYACGIKKNIVMRISFPDRVNDIGNYFS